MTWNTFTWCDLSTYDLHKARAFYQAVLGWSAHSLGASQYADDYTLFYSGSNSAAGVYTMPVPFQNIKMPSFWMSYVRVESLDDCCKRAVELGAKCEVEPTQLDVDSRIALIRDPAGAGFTLYQGPELHGLDSEAKHGRMCCNELHVSDFNEVESFYTNLFGWKINTDPVVPYRKLIHDSTDNTIASALELDESTKGPKNYWAITFATDDIDRTLEAATNAGGEVLMQPDGALGFAMVMDNQGAMFCLTLSRV